MKSRDFVSATGRLVEWERRALGNSEEKDSCMIVLAASAYGSLYLGASLWGQSAIMLLPLPTSKKKSKPAERSIIKQFRADSIVKLAAQLEPVDAELRVIYDDDLKEARFYWRKCKRVLVSDGLSNLLAPFMYSWIEQEPAFTASIQREPWLRALRSVSLDTAFHKWEWQGAAPGLCAIEKHTIGFQMLSARLSLSLPTRPLIAYLEMAEAPCVVLRTHRLYGSQKSYTTRLLTPDAEFFSYCFDAGPML